MTKKAAFLGATIGVGGLVSGCGLATSPLGVQVRDARTKEPLVGVWLEADSAALGPSLKFGDVVDQLRGRRAALVSRGLTDERGGARLEFLPDRSVRVTLVDGARGTPFAILSDVEAGPTGWLEMTTAPSFPPVEIRAGTPASITSPSPARAGR